jgi:hypothetical protein
MAEEPPCSTELRALIDQVLQRALDFLSEQGSAFVPFLVLEGPDGTPYVPVANGKATNCEAAARKQARGLPQEVRRCALVHCGEAMVDGQPMGAVFVEGSERGCARSVVFARAYRIREDDGPAEFVGDAQVVARASPLFAKRRRRWHRWLISGMALLTFAVGLLVCDNNFSCIRTPSQEFEGRLTHAIWAGTDWLTERQREIAVEQPNPALLYMIGDMADLSKNPRLRRIVDLHLETYPNYPGRRLLDEKAPFLPPRPDTLAGMDDYQRWFLHACAQSEFPLEDEDRASMLSPTMHRRGSLTHQLLALCILRQRGRSGENLDGLVDTLCERVAAEAVWDFRVTDLYLQRVAFLLAAGRPDLVRPRWVERILAWQQENGGWKGSWYSCWGPGVFAFRWGPQVPNAHTTVQGVWLLYMLEYRYPRWIVENYR